MRIHKLLEPAWKKSLISIAVAASIIALDFIFIYCTEDMCFNGIHRITGDKYYFLGANIMMYTIYALAGYSAFNLVFWLGKKIIRKKD